MLASDWKEYFMNNIDDPYGIALKREQYQHTKLLVRNIGLLAIFAVIALPLISVYVGI
jgi:hypothetical protein